MVFDTQRKIFYSYNGRILLTTNLPFPIADDSVQQRYINNIIKNCESFCENKLYPLLLKYDGFNNDRSKNYVYQYKVSVDLVFSSDSCSSYLIIALLSIKEQILTCGCRAVTFCDNQIIPNSFICSDRKYKKANLLFDRNGNPAKAQINNGVFSITPIK